MNSLTPAGGNPYGGFSAAAHASTESQSGSSRESITVLEVQACQAFRGLQGLSEGGRALVLRQVIAMHNEQTCLVKNKIESPPAQVDFKTLYPVLNGIIKKMATILTESEIQEFEIMVFGRQSTELSEAWRKFPNSALRAKEAFFQQYFLKYGVVLGITWLIKSNIGFYPHKQAQIFELLNTLLPKPVNLQH